MSKQTSMKKNENGAMISSTNAVEEIRQFFEEWKTVPCIYKTLANAYADVDFLKGFDLLKNHDFENITEALDYSMMMIDLMERIINKEGEE